MFKEILIKINFFFFKSVIGWNKEKQNNTKGSWYRLKKLVSHMQLRSRIYKEVIYWPQLSGRAAFSGQVEEVSNEWRTWDVL